MLSSTPNVPVAEPRVLIVILNWNSCEETIAAVRSAERMSYPRKHILIIDNGSVDGSVSQLGQLRSESVELICRPSNEGFTGGCNLGFDVAMREDFDYVWLLNNDAITDADTLNSLVQLAESNPKIGLVSPKIASLQEPLKALNLGGLYRPEIPTFESTKNMTKARDWAERQPKWVMLMGTALLVRVALIRTIGKLDDAMFAYWEDTDYSLRAILAGFKNQLDFNSVIYHKEKDAGKEAMEMKPHYWYYMARNEIRFWKKHTTMQAKLRALWWTYTFNLNNLRLLRGNSTSRQAVLAGLWDGLTGRVGPYRVDRKMPSLAAKLAEWHSEAGVSLRAL